MTEFLISGPPRAELTLLLAHGAGAPMDSEFMTTFADLLAQRGMRVARFEFEYMAARRVDARRRPPPRAERLLEPFRAVVHALTAPSTLIIGGKSLGGRVASMVADELYKAKAVAGLVCLGYPFHPPGKSDRLRTAHLTRLNCPALICQGTRDPLGGADEVHSYDLSRAISIHWAEDGDHDLTPRKTSGLTRQDNWRSAADAIATFAKSVRV